MNRNVLLGLIKWWTLAAAAVVLAAACSSGEDDSEKNAGACEGGAVCSGVCRDVASDERHCGDCDQTCSTAEFCFAGSCECASERSACDGACVDLQSNPDHCGQCGNPCGPDQVCSEGACADSCTAGLTQCGRACVDPKTAIEHCGSCNKACDAGLVCTDGQCGCSPSEELCSGACVSTGTSQVHCGECGNSCGAGDVCQSGSCTPSVNLGSGGATGSDPDAGGDNTCATQQTKAEPQPVFLLFLLDESGSMGDGKHGNIDQKWNPVKKALKSFFTDAGSTGISSSLTLFGPDYNKDPEAPADDKTWDREEACSAATYETPNVSLTELPSESFGALMDEVTPPNEWSTPTRPALEGVLTSAAKVSADHPNAHVAIVLVTDGEPSQCQTNSVSDVRAVAEAGFANGIPTYVVGVGELGALDSIAEGGGTEKAFIVSVKQPQQTQQSFLEAINTIRGATASCNLTIPPPPPGKSFDQVTVRYTSGSGEAQDLTYSEECAEGSGWHYDDPANPAEVQLCPAACKTLRADSEAGVGVLFGCSTVIELPK